MKDGLDDFRNGCPSCDDVIIPCPRDSFLIPSVCKTVHKPEPPKSPKVEPKKFPKSATKDHNLSFLPSVQTLMDVLERLRSRAQIGEFVYDTADDKQYFSVLPVLEENDSKEYLVRVVRGPCFMELLDVEWLPPIELPKEKKVRRRSFPRSHPVEILVEVFQPSEKEEEKKPEEKKKKRKKKKHSQKFRHRKHIPKVIREFCRWAIALGEHDVTERYVMKLFDLDGEFKPVYQTARIKNVSDMPLRLRYRRTLTDEEEIEFAIDESNWEKKLVKLPDPYKPIPMKIRYGAWYLKPRLWTKLINDEPLVDPEKLLEAQGLGRWRPRPDVLEELYGTIAFKDYVVAHGYKMPWIIEKLFTKKKWAYDQYKTPMQRVLKMYPLLGKDSEEEKFRALQSK